MTELLSSPALEITLMCHDDDDDQLVKVGKNNNDGRIELMSSQNYHLQTQHQMMIRTRLFLPFMYGEKQQE